MCGTNLELMVIPSYHLQLQQKFLYLASLNVKTLGVLMLTLEL